jgi:outer membrane lipoprotein-sorting protein
MKQLLILAVLTNGLLVTPMLAAEQSIENVKKEIVKKWSDVRTMSAKIDMEVNLNTPRPFKTNGNYEYMRDGKIEKKRMYLYMESEIEGQKISMSQTVIQDGEFAWSLSEGMGQKRLFKQKPSQMEGTPGGEATFEEMEQAYELKLQPEETREGKAMIVIEATAKKPDDTGISKYKMYFDKENAVLSRVVGYDTQDAVATIINYTDIKINEKIDPERFVFKNEDNLQVIDMTRMDD